MNLVFGIGEVSGLVFAGVASAVLAVADVRCVAGRRLQFTKIGCNYGLLEHMLLLIFGMVFLLKLAGKSKGFEL